MKVRDVSMVACERFTQEQQRLDNSLKTINKEKSARMAGGKSGMPLRLTPEGKDPLTNRGHLALCSDSFAH